MINFKDFISIFLFTVLLTLSYSCKQEKKTTNEKQIELDSKTYKNVEKYPNGRIKIKGDIVNGIKQGKWEAFYENGNKWSECTYRFGKKKWNIQNLLFKWKP